MSGTGHVKTCMGDKIPIKELRNMIDYPIISRFLPKDVCEGCEVVECGPLSMALLANTDEPLSKRVKYECKCRGFMEARLYGDEVVHGLEECIKKGPKRAKCQEEGFNSDDWERCEGDLVEGDPENNGVTWCSECGNGKVNTKKRCCCGGRWVASEEDMDASEPYGFCALCGNEPAPKGAEIVDYV